MTQRERAHLLKKLHIKGDPLILFNIWDARSAQAIQEIGAKAIATSSWSVAAAHGYEDGEKLSFDFAFANLQRIIANVDLPVTVDLEGGYGQSPQQVQKTVSKVIEAGAVGINIEDQIIGQKQLYSIEDQCARIKAVHKAAEYASIPLFINARTDIFLKTDSSHHNDNHLEEALRRTVAYAKSGADGFFAPGLKDPTLIKKLCALSPIPINVMMRLDMPSSKQLAEFGVARISYGPGPYDQTMEALKEAGRNVLSKLYNREAGE
ncbi:MAG: isocitrate lyase/phosphoenolpyruvate mutase family protein [Alphaproteobacteria bacterium]|nr:isocitrate lyase/phosphoenolpyruvate mutase family protein [Alphaproteobacteria bacterium]